VTVDLDPCAQWRVLASCELDGELSELDAVRLEHHLAGCGACHAWLAEVRELATALRAEPLEAPERRFDLSATRRRMLHASTVAAAVVASAAAAALAILPVAVPTNGQTASHAAQGAEVAGKRDVCPVCLARNLVVLSLTGDLNQPQTPGHGAVLS
jgi:predicted anti-sigma-YlaC factor YlaD